MVCPAPLADRGQILMAHGGGGRLTQQLFEQVFLPAFDNEALRARHDGAILSPPAGRLAFTTDSYVVRPLFFPGGDIGTLAVHGTVNDLAMCGARPLWISAGCILEEGLPLETLRGVVKSMQAAATESQVSLVTGDTKVVDRGRCDGMYVTTSGIGLVEHDLTIGPASVQPGDVVLLSGDVGRHGMAVMACREGMEFDSAIESDCASLAAPVLRLLEAGIEVHCLRDLTRGGLATALVEIAQAGRTHVRFDERLVPVAEAVRGACEVLGLDPLYVANEGRMVVFLPAAQAERALGILREFAVTTGACRIGEVLDGPSGTVAATSAIGAPRLVDLLSGEQLPRIC